MVEEHHPNIISFQEATAIWSQVLKDSLPQYYFVCHELDTPFGICVAVNIPVVEEEVFFVQNNNVPSIFIRVTVDSEVFSVVLSHPKPPFTQQFFRQRNAHMEKLRIRFAAEENLIVIGDLNNTQWSPMYQSLEENLQVKNTLSGFQNTWPASFPIPIFQLDHILVSKHLDINNAEVLADVGSDHYPIIADISLPGKRIDHTN